jgi:hypothetical protein
LSAWDDCGNTIKKERKVTIVDSRDPEITVQPAGDVTVPCEDYSNYKIPKSFCVDDCTTTTLTRKMEKMNHTCDQDFTLLVTWDCNDDHGRTNTHTLSVTIVDDTPPSLSFYRDQTSYPCDYDIPLPTIIATDNCDNDISVTFTEEKIWKDYIENSKREAPDLNQLFILNGFVRPEYYSISPSHIEAMGIIAGQSWSLVDCEVVCKLWDGRNCFGVQVWSSQVDDSTSCYLYSKEAICKAQKEAYKVPGTQSDITSGVIGQGNWAIREELLFEGICEFDSEPIHLCV